MLGGEKHKLRASRRSATSYARESIASARSRCRYINRSIGTHKNNNVYMRCAPSDRLSRDFSADHRASEAG
eukprot:6176988-Pleurochrysis_carterae.AAC.4